jgi:subtilisin family serine protease
MDRRSCPSFWEEIVTRQRNRNPLLVRIIDQQVDRITEAFRAQGIEIKTVRDAEGGVSYSYAEGRLLVREKDLGRVQAILGQPPGLEHVTQVIGDVVLLRLVKAVKRDDALYQVRVKRGVQPSVIAALEIVDEHLGRKAATPDHVMTVAPGGPCPATEPEEVYERTEPYPGVCTENSGEGALVYIADTGLLEDAEIGHPWLVGVQRALGPDGNEQPWDPDRRPDPLGGPPKIPPYAGHGTFVAGVVRCMAPRADVIVSNVFKVAGSSLESHFVRQLKHALGLGVDIFHLAITAPTRADLPLKAFERWLRLLHQYKGVVCVVAAGNDGSRRPTWPAAFPHMVSVGALTADGRDRADFSNYGGWVDVYAPGRDLVNAYASGPYRCDEEPYKGQIRTFYGMCKWSGTSFSTPIVTGLIADRMGRTGENGQEAAAALLAEARAQAIPGVGAILLPCGRRREGGCRCREGGCRCREGGCR